MWTLRDWQAQAAMAFFVAGAYSIIGHHLLYWLLRRRGLPMNRLLRGIPLYPSIRYFSNRSLVQSKGLDFLAVSAPACLILVLAMAVILAPVFWPDA